MALAAVFSYITRAFLARVLDIKDYGLFYAISTFVFFFIVFREIGIPLALAKFIPEYQIKNKYGLIKGAILITIAINLFLTLIIASLFFIFSPYLAANYFKIPEASIIIRLFIICFVFSFLDTIFLFALQGFQKMQYASSILCIRVAVIFGFVLLFYQRLGSSILVPTYAYITGYIISLFICFALFIKHAFPTFFKVQANISASFARKLIVFGLPNVFVYTSGAIIAYTDTLFLTYFKTMDEVALYNVAVPSASFLWFFTMAISTVFLPMVSELWTKKKKHLLANGMSELHKYSFILVIPFALILFSFSKLFLRVFFGVRYEPASTVLQIFTIGAVFYTIGYLNLTFFIGIGKPQYNMKFMLAAALFNVFANLLLIPIFGMIGAAVASAISYFILMVMSSIQIRKHIDLKIPWHAWGKSFFAGAISILGMGILKYIIVLSVFAEAIICIIAGTIIYITLLFALRVVTIAEIKNMLKRIRPDNLKVPL